MGAKKKAFRAWLVARVAEYKRGEMMSMAEAVQGEAAFEQVLQKFDETFKDDK